MVLTRVCDIRSPEPADAPVTLPAGIMPVVHAKVVNGVALDRTIFMEPVEHIVWKGGAAMATGFGLTVTMTFKCDPGHPFANGVTV